jgi:cysteine-rich repeat protein
MRGELRVASLLLLLAVAAGGATAQSCPGDCDGDGQVSIAELIRGVRIALGEASADECPPVDGNGDGVVTVNELVAAVRASLEKCVADTPTPTMTPIGPFCGNGVAEAPEECDDGNTAGGDGCSAACELEPGGDVCAGVPIADGAALRAVLVAAGLQNPVHATAPPLDPNRLFIVEQRGRVRLVKTTADGRELLETPFLDIVDRVRSGSFNDERGFLSIAFHPDYESNGWFFANYTCRAPNCPPGADDSSTVISRFTRSADPDWADAASERVLLTVDQPFTNHNGGQLAFGPDGYLYVGMGDGGSGFDPQGNAQSDATLLGKMLRVDVDVAEPPYWRAPDDNPAGGEGELALIWAKGLRNPWRFSFDRANGDLYIGDVGQRTFEEIDVQPGTSRGGENYGWVFYEAGSCVAPPNCPDRLSFVFPVLQYGRNDGISVTGGFVYRGCAMPSLRGTYFYSDFGSAFIRTFVLLDGTATQRRDRTAEIAVPSGLDIQFPASYGEDARGELYIVDRDGEVFQLVADE